MKYYFADTDKRKIKKDIEIIIINQKNLEKKRKCQKKKIIKKGKST